MNSAYICITMEASHVLKPTEKQMWVFTHTTTPPVEFIKGDYFKHQGEWIFLLSLVFSESYIDVTLFFFPLFHPYCQVKGTEKTQDFHFHMLPIPHLLTPASPKVALVPALSWTLQAPCQAQLLSFGLPSHLLLPLQGHGSGYSPFHSCFLKFKFLLAVRFSTNLQRCCYFSWLNKFFLDLTFPSSYLSLLSSLYSKKNLKPYLYSLTVSNFFPWFHRNHS